MGVTFEGRQSRLGILYDDYVTEGYEDLIKLGLERQPDNPHDPNAIAVVVTRPKRAGGQVGFVPRDLAAKLAAVMEREDGIGIAYVSCGVLSKGSHIGLTVKLTRERGGDQG